MPAFFDLRFDFFLYIWLTYIFKIESRFKWYIFVNNFDTLMIFAFINSNIDIILS